LHFSLTVDSFDDNSFVKMQLVARVMEMVMTMLMVMLMLLIVVGKVVMLEMVTLIAVVLLISKDQMMLVEVVISQDPLFFCVADAQKTLSSWSYQLHSDEHRDPNI
jgi:hypothetical protein